MEVEVNYKDLVELIGRPVQKDELEDLLFLLKVEVESWKGDIIELEINPDRQDMISVEGIARALKGFMEIETGIPKYKINPPQVSVKVHSSVKEVRPYIATAILRGVENSDELLKSYMHMQEKLTSTFGKHRINASIGLYVLKDIKFPVIYTTEEPKRIQFVPLGMDKIMNGKQILQSHPKGQEFGHIIKDYERWPLLKDSAGKILSLPPIINSNDVGQVTPNVHDIFVEVTGTRKEVVQYTLNIFVANLLERRGIGEAVRIEYPDTTEITPDFTTKKWELSVQYVNEVTGLNLSPREIEIALQKMRFNAKKKNVRLIDVEVPAFRMDILHPIDLVEDVAIGYGFDNIEPEMPQTFTEGKVLKITKLQERIKDIMIGAGFQEIMSYIMTNNKILNEYMCTNNQIVEVANPKSQDYSALRDRILPIIMEFLAKNVHEEYPQKIFEVGDVVVIDEEAETRTRNVPRLAAAIAENKVNFTNIKTITENLFQTLGITDDIKYKPAEHPSFIPGRVAEIFYKNESIGYIGEIHPEVLTNFQIIMPVAAFEINLKDEWLY